MEGDELERRSYVIVREDGFVVHTKPIGERRAEWLLREAYYMLGDRDLRARYLSQWGNVINIDAQAPQDVLKRLAGLYRDPDELLRRLADTLHEERFAQLRQQLEGLYVKLRKFLEERVEPRPLERPERPALAYAVMDTAHVFIDDIEGKVSTLPRADWHALTYDSAGAGPINVYGISVFRDAFWFWRQRGGHRMATSDVEAVVVRRNADDKDLISALVDDPAAAKFLKVKGEIFAVLIDRNAARLKEAGYEDVAKKAKNILKMAELLTA